MANEEHLRILKTGVKLWNMWREAHPDVKPNLTDVDLTSAILCGAHLSNTKLTGADLTSTNLSSADLTNSTLIDVNLSAAKLIGADLTGADLAGAILSGAYLNAARLLNANLPLVNLAGADLSDADFSGALISMTLFVDNDLSTVKGLDSVNHIGPSDISISTVYRSKGNIPESFLRGCGVPDNFITYMHSLTGKAFEYYSCFISYSSKDQPFAERLYADLQSKGVRCWYAPEDLKIGDKFRQRIDESIRLHDKLLVILSEQSISSAWVEEEVESAIEREHKEKRLVLFPIRIDDSVINSEQAWAASLRRMRHIGDFCGWKEHDSYVKAFDRLMRDLKAEQPQ